MTTIRKMVFVRGVGSSLPLPKSEQRTYVENTLGQLKDSVDPTAELNAISSILASDPSIVNSLDRTTWVKCDRNMIMIDTNPFFATRSNTLPKEFHGRSLMYERDYQNSPVSLLYENVRRTGLLGFALIQPKSQSNKDFSVVAFAREDGSLEVLSQIVDAGTSAAVAP